MKSELPLFLGAYPITPASGILEELAGYKHFGIRTFQAEDEIAAVGAALGASFGGSLGVTTSSGPGHRAQAGDDRPRGHARAAARDPRHPARRPVDRHADEAGAGRPAERACSAATRSRRCRWSRPSTPGDCFDAAIEACRIALKYRTPVFMLSDAYLANGSEPWLIPDPDSIPDIAVEFATEPNQDGAFMPYLRDPETLARPWAVPGDAGPRAPDRRAREGGRDRERLLRPRQPRLHGPDPRAEGRRHRGRHPRARGRPRRGREAARARLGRDVRPDHRRRAPRAEGGRQGRAGAPAASEPVPAQPRRRAALATTGC